jgi:hypothetical protein
MDSEGGFCAGNPKDSLGLVHTEVIGNDAELTRGGLSVHYLFRRSTNSWLVGLAG